MWGFQNVMRGLDSFGKEIPSFNLKGENRVNTVVGGIVTTVIFTLSLFYSAIKGIELFERRSPQISEGTIEEFYGMEDVLNFNEVGIRFAFSVVGVVD